MQKIRLAMSSNYPCMGKDTLLLSLEKKYGLKAMNLRVGDLLRIESKKIVTKVNEGINLNEIADEWEIDREAFCETIDAFTSEELTANNPEIKTEGQRTLQQNLGLKFYDEYHWAEKMREAIQKNQMNPFLVSAGVRLVPEANVFNEEGFIHIRLEGSKTLAKKRSFLRDGVKITNSQLDHPVERALDGYDKFDLIIDANKPSKEISDIAYDYLAGKH